MEPRKVVLKIRDLNPHVVCSLCAGYFVDATTITECLHTFCKSCIVKYFQTSKYCPMCNLKIHETQPLINLRLDRTMQDIVAKVVPDILEAEETRRREFYESRGMLTEKPPVHDENENESSTVENKVKRDYSECKNMYKEDELVSLCVERDRVLGDAERRGYTEPTLSKKYLRCSARMMVIHLQKFLRRKLSIPDDQEVEIVCNEHVIHPGRTMKFIWISEWLDREPPMVLHYRVRDS